MRFSKGRYLIGAGDILNIIVWRNPELSMSVPVRPDGKLTTPLVDEVVAQGKTPVEMSREIEKVLGKQLKDDDDNPMVGDQDPKFVAEQAQRFRLDLAS